MSAALHPSDRPRRGRPPARNQILQSGRLAGLDPRELAERFGTPLYIYDLPEPRVPRYSRMPPHVMPYAIRK
jgi:hypothetical protein